MGLSPLIAETVPHKLKRTLGMLGYMIWAVRVAFKFRPFRLRITEGGRVHKVWATEARIANGTHHGGIELVESADLQSGEIVVQAVTGKSLVHLAWSWLATLFKLKLPRPDRDRVSRSGNPHRSAAAAEDIDRRGDQRHDPRHRYGCAGCGMGCGPPLTAMRDCFHRPERK